MVFSQLLYKYFRGSTTLPFSVQQKSVAWKLFAQQVHMYVCVFSFSVELLVLVIQFKTLINHHKQLMQGYPSYCTLHC